MNINIYNNKVRKNKVRAIRFLPSCLLAFLLLTSCSDFLDVRPKTEVESNDLFKDESGYTDALWGIYTQMASTSEYGRNMTWGAVDAIGQAYSNAGSGVYYYLKNYDYTRSASETLINAMWQSTYNTIANVNNLIENMQATSADKFEANHYNVILGEALALRAYLHFDMLRLFAKAPVVDASALAIPYVTAYSHDVTPQSTVSEVIDKCIADLEQAATLLKTSDPIATGVEPEADDALLIHRYFHINYYAVRAEEARIYLYAGDKANAATCAREVINSGKFTWTSVDDVATTATNRDRTFTSEQIFALQVNDMEDNYQNYLNETRFTGNRLVISSNSRYLRYGSAYDILDTRYTSDTDWRKLYLFSDVISGDNYYMYRFPAKLYQMEDMPTTLAKRQPLLRLPEMYLILAEADEGNAASYLNTIRQHRGVTEEVNSQNTTDMQKEILSEYLREFICEGVMFYQYKRLNVSRMLEARSDFNTDLYVLPMPEEETTWGNRQ